MKSKLTVICIGFVLLWCVAEGFAQIKVYPPYTQPGTFRSWISDSLDSFQADSIRADEETITESNNTLSVKWNGADDLTSTGEIAANAVGSSNITDGAVVNADVNASAAIAGTKIVPQFEDSLKSLVYGTSDTLELRFTEDPNPSSGNRGLKIKRYTQDTALGIGFYTGSTFDWDMGTDATSGNPVLCYLPGIGDIVRLDDVTGKMIVGPGIGDPNALSYQLTVSVGDSSRKGIGVTTSTTNAIEGTSTSGYGLKGASGSYGGYFTSSGSHAMYVKGDNGKGIYLYNSGISIGGQPTDDMSESKLVISSVGTDSLDFLNINKTADADWAWINWHQGTGVKDWRMGMLGDPYSLTLYAANGASVSADSPGTRSFTFSQTGQFAIGSSEPTQALDVTGNGLFTNAVANTYNKSNAFLGLQGSTVSDHFWGLRLNSGGDLCFDTYYGGNPFERINIERLGYVGIGKDPDEMLDVNGNIAADTLKADVQANVVTASDSLTIGTGGVWLQDMIFSVTGDSLGKVVWNTVKAQLDTFWTP
jgi:hypothetical protein